MVAASPAREHEAWRSAPAAGYFSIVSKYVPIGCFLEIAADQVTMGWLVWICLQDHHSADHAWVQQANVVERA